MSEGWLLVVVLGMHCHEYIYRVQNKWKAECFVSSRRVLGHQTVAFGGLLSYYSTAGSPASKLYTRRIRRRKFVKMKKVFAVLRSQLQLQREVHCCRSRA